MPVLWLDSLQLGYCTPRIHQCPSKDFTQQKAGRNCSSTLWHLFEISRAQLSFIKCDYCSSLTCHSLPNLREIEHVREMEQLRSSIPGELKKFHDWISVAVQLGLWKSNGGQQACECSHGHQPPPPTFHR